MHGVIFSELKKFVESRLGPDSWRALLREAGLGGHIYLPLSTYPDEEIFTLVETASRLTGIAPAALLRSFGEYMAPDLLRMYQAYLRPQWTTLDVIEHTEEQIHTRVRVREPGAMPPFLQAQRVSPTEVRLLYSSPRKLCAIAEGIALGLAGHFGETITIAHPACMHDGAEACELRFVLQ
ncbi:MAG TPA: heme NO-binding domain-containing protein [Longimicrobium sp.]|nr:heme NO-binding domain-containing protein [Longimicrobium sp.]